MSVPMKKRRTEKIVKVTWHGNCYAVPLRVIEKFKVTQSDKASVSIDEVFSDLINETSEPAVLLRGLRHKEGLSQIEFSKLIGVTQTNLSAMENGRRSIGKDIAKRIANKFSVDYRLFL